MCSSQQLLRRDDIIFYSVVSLADTYKFLKIDNQKDADAIIMKRKHLSTVVNSKRKAKNVVLTENDINVIFDVIKRKTNVTEEQKEKYFERINSKYI